MSDAPSAEIEFEFEVWQGDQPVAWANAYSLADAAREASHYAAVYQQDGPVEVRRVSRVLVTAAELEGWARDASLPQKDPTP
jgi:hypothetical protein